MLKGILSKFKTLAILSLFLDCSAYAAVESARTPIADKCRFAPFEENSVIWNKMQNNGWPRATNDENALRAHYSLKYVIWGTNAPLTHTGSELFFSYTGEFDFYLNTRYSGPVINRISNPALHFRLDGSNHPCDENSSNSSVDYVDVGIEHYSNGQTRDVSPGLNAQLAQQRYNMGDHQFFDTISRGSNFLSFGGQLSDGSNISSIFTMPVGLRATVRYYINQDSDITWGPFANQGVRLSDYNRISFLASKRTGIGVFEVRWTVGDRWLNTSSQEITYQIPSFDSFWSVPLYIKYHHGPLNTLSNYTQRQDSIGIGFVLFAY